MDRLYAVEGKVKRGSLEEALPDQYPSSSRKRKNQ